MGIITSLALDGIFDAILGLINLIVNFVGGLLIGLAASIVNYGFSFQSFIKVPAVQIGWTLSRDIANMAFILIMLGIAFATILQMDTFGVKKKLPALIAMALLLNFSLVVCGVFIDIGNSLGRFFVSGGETANVGDNIMAAVRAGQVAQIRNQVAVGSPVTALIMASVVQLIFYLILVFLLFALGIMMILRIINLWLLVILSPLAWICLIIPKMDSYYSQWWQKFLKWAFFPAAVGFFIFLGLLTGATFFGSEMGMGLTDVGGWGWILPETFLATIMQFIVVVSILFTGLITAEKWGISGAKTMVGWAESGKKWATGKVKAGGKATAGMAMLGAKTALDKGLARTPLGGLGQIRERLEKAPVIGRAIGGPGARFAAQQKALKDAEGKLKGLRPQDLRAILNQLAVTPEGQARRAAALSVLADKGKLKNEHAQYAQGFVDNGGNINDLLQKMPAWAIEKAEIQQILAKNPATAKDWAGVVALPVNSDERKQKAAEVLKEKVFSKSADYLKIQKNAIDAKGSMTDAEYDSYKEAQKENERKKNETREIIESEFEKAENRIRSIHSNGALSDDVKEQQVKEVRAGLKKLTSDLEKEIISIEEQQLVKGVNDAQYLFRKIMKEEMGEGGKVQVGALNSLANDSPAVYQEFKNYLRTHATALKARGEIKDNIYKHLIAGPIANITGSETTTT